MNTKEKRLAPNISSYSSSYKRTNEPVHKEKTVHCIDALEDIVDTLLNKFYKKIEYYHTDSVVILKLDNTSYRFVRPISGNDITFFIHETLSNQNMNNKEKLIDRVLEATDVANISREHCLNCYKISKCKAYEKYLTL